MIVVAAIVGIISAIAVPAILNTLHKIRVDQVAEQILWDLQHSRTAAIRHRINCKVEFGTGGTYTATLQTNPTRKIADVDIKKRYPGIEFNCKDQDGNIIADPVNDVTFTKTRTANTASIFIMPSEDILANRSDRMRRITINTTGRIRIKRYVTGACDGGTWE